MIHFIRLKRGLKFQELPEKEQKKIRTLFDEQNSASFELEKNAFKWGAIKGKSAYYLFLPQYGKYAHFPFEYYEADGGYQDESREKMYNGSYFKTEEGKEKMKQLQDMQTKVNEVTSTGSVGGSYETAGLVIPKRDMDELNSFKEDPNKMYEEEDEKNENNNDNTKKMKNKIVKEIAIKTFKQLMAEKYIFNQENVLSEKTPRDFADENNPDYEWVVYVGDKAVNGWEFFTDAIENGILEGIIGISRHELDEETEELLDNLQEMDVEEIDEINDKIQELAYKLDYNGDVRLRKVNEDEDYGLNENFNYNSPAAKVTAKNRKSATEKRSSPKAKDKKPKKENDLVDDKNRRMTDDEKTEGVGEHGQQNIEYDGISEKAKEQNEKNIKNGDGGKDGLWAGKNYSDPDLGKKIAKKAKDNLTKKQKATPASFSVGDDIEFPQGAKNKQKSTGFKESKKINKNFLKEAKVSSIDDKDVMKEKDGYYFFDKDGKYVGYSKNNARIYHKWAKDSKGKKLAPKCVHVRSGKIAHTYDNSNLLNKTLNENKKTMKKYIFKHDLFESAEDVVAKIPQRAKKNDNVFLMEDMEGNNVKFQWIGNDEGSVTLLEEKFPKKEQLFEDQRSTFSSYDSESTLGGTTLNEDEMFFDMLNVLNGKEEE